jgi:outer membrane protein TolC
LQQGFPVKNVCSGKVYCYKRAMHETRKSLREKGSYALGLCLVAVIFLSACTAPYYRKSADRQVYRIIDQTTEDVLGERPALSIETRYSTRDPQEIFPEEILEDRQAEEAELLTLSDAIRVAVENNRQYQLRKENLYLAALNLTGELHEFRPRFFAGSTVAGERTTIGQARLRANTRGGVSQALRTGGSIGLNIANDVLRFYTGDPTRTAISTISVNLFQPLLRGAGAIAAAESLTQAERNVIYEIRDFSHFQNVFILEVTVAYLRLLQLQDTVRNDHEYYLGAQETLSFTEALGEDRMTMFQVDQARQSALDAQNNYITSVERYQASLDQFKITLGLPLTHRIKLDTQPLIDLVTVGLIPFYIEETEAFQMVVERRLDLLNEIDRFEDSKRRILVAANLLKPDLNLFADASLQSQGPTDYTRFDLNQWQGGVGLQLNLPLDRLRERNIYRGSIITFERQLRSLSLTLDSLRNQVNQEIRNLGQTRQTYDIQTQAVALAERRVHAAPILIQAQRMQVREQLEAQLALLRARNNVTRAAVDYHVARMRLLLEIGHLRTEEEQFWLLEPLPHLARPELVEQERELISPETLFHIPL